MAAVATTGNPKARQRAQAADEANSTRNREDLGDGSVGGNLTADPELRYTQAGRAVINLRVAQTPRTKGDDGKWVDGEPVFYDITVWGQQAENAAECLLKGDRIVARGRWQRETWTYEDTEHERITLIARDVAVSILFRPVSIKRTQRQTQTTLPK